MTPLFAMVVFLLLRLVTAAVPSGYPVCAAKCVDSTCPMEDLDCICTNVTSIGSCIGSNCSSTDASSAAPFIGFCCTFSHQIFIDLDLSGTPTFGSQTASVSSTGTTGATGIQTTTTGSAAAGAPSGVSGGSGSGTVAPSRSAASSSGSSVGGNGLFVGFLAVFVGITVGGLCRLEFG